MTLQVYPLYLAGKEQTTGRKLTVEDKHTSEPIAAVSTADSQIVESAIQAAVLAREAMRNLADYQRRDILLHVHEQVQSRLDELAEVLIREAGKTITDAKGEVSRALDTLLVAAEEATRIGGEYMPLEISERGRKCRAIMKRVPIGPCSFICPWNFPVNLSLHKVAPAIAAGNPFILKPASTTPISAIMLGEMLAKTDLPPEAFSILPMSAETSAPLVEDDRMKMLSFTGSPGVGWSLKSKAGRKRVSLELGGNAACIVDRDVDIEHVTKRIVFGGFYQGGQSCISVQRVLIHHSIFEDLTQRIVAAARDITPGDPRDDDTFLSPLIDDSAAQRIEEWLDTAKKSGARILCGGKRDGRLMMPTVLRDVPDTAKLYCEEVFGPVIMLEPFDDFDDAIRKTNDSEYGLQAGVFTTDLNHTMQAFDELDVGAVIINDVPAMRVDSMPYGGVKQSGHGREGLRWAIEEMTELRMMVLKNIGKRE